MNAVGIWGKLQVKSGISQVKEQRLVKSSENSEGYPHSESCECYKKCRGPGCGIWIGFEDCVLLLLLIAHTTKGETENNVNDKEKYTEE